MSDTATTELLAAAKDAASRGVDYYALLGIEPSTDIITRESVQRAWRKRSLKYHPDKAKAGFDKSKWEEFGLARDVLASDEARGAYDGARSALLRRQREKDAMNARQRRFVEELEEAEGRGSRAREEEVQRRGEEEERERGRQAAEGRRIMEERQRLMREAEERERERERREDDARDDRERELERKLEEIRRRKAEKKGRARKGGAVEIEVEAKRPSPPPAAAASAPRPAESRSVPVPQRDVQMSDDPVQFWTTQWPKTKARLQAAQAMKEQRLQAAGTVV